MNSRQEPVALVRTRKALNSLQYSPNGKDLAGLSHNLKLNQPELSKKQVLFEVNEKLTKLKKRTSISLPDINSYCDIKDANSLNKSATSTPNKAALVKQISASKSNISVIFEEKENPNHINLNMDKLASAEAAVNVKKPSKTADCREVSIQCNKAEEDMVFADSVSGTDYWRLIAHKRFKALVESKSENKLLNDQIEGLNEKNEKLREDIKELYSLLDQYNEIKKTMLESCESQENDSGYDL